MDHDRVPIETLITASRLGQRSGWVSALGRILLAGRQGAVLLVLGLRTRGLSARVALVPRPDSGRGGIPGRRLAIVLHVAPLSVRERHRLTTR